MRDELNASAPSASRVAAIPVEIGQRGVILS
jgi:hypothetical protein